MLSLADFSLGDLLLGVLWIFGFVIFFWLLITIFSDLWRDHEMSGWGKAAWVLFVIIFPFIGILIYLIVRGGGMSQRALAEQKRARAEFDQYVRETAGGGGGGGGTADELDKLAGLRDKGVISQEEFDAQKRKLLA